MAIIQSLKWRYATKKFDATKKVSDEDLQTLMESVQLAATSYGLQAFKVINVTDPEVRKLLQPASWGQSQIVDASHLFVFCAFRKITDEMVDELVDRKAKTQGIPAAKLEQYGTFMKGKIGEKSEAEIINWNAKQTYIALGNLLATAGELQIDACPMEGFTPAEYDKILGLTDKNLTASVLCAIGYRSEEDRNQHLPKVRKSVEALFETI